MEIGKVEPEKIWKYKKYSVEQGLMGIGKVELEKEISMV